MKKFLLFWLLLLSVLSSAEVRVLRHPSYHNGKVAFSYLGDIWVANEDGSNPQRITVHRARDIYPRFSPDGKWIAFSSNRYGNYDVFVVPATGGPARQLTYHSASDTVVGWTPDSKRVIFQSSRGLMFPGIPNLYEVPLEGGLEQPLPTDWGYWGGYSSDGSRFVFNRHPMVWWRQHYRGSYAADLWVMDVKQKKFKQLADGDYKGNYFWPMAASDGFIYFVSDRLPNESGIKPGSKEVMKSVNNLWKIPEGGGKAVQVTHHTTGRLFFPSISADGKTIVYEEDAGLWKLDTKTGKSAAIKVDISSDDKENDFETLTVRNDTESYDLSPSTKRAAVSVHGEIFSISTDRGDLQRVTQSYSRETSPSWSPDGKWVAFVSDKSGREEVWIAHEDSSGLKKISDSDAEKQAIRWAPDSKWLIYAGSDHKLSRYDFETGKTSVIASSDAGNILGARISPDGKWVAYSRLDSDLRPHVYIAASTGGNEHHIGDDDRLFSETTPAWTPDGKRLMFLAGLAQAGSAVQRQTLVQLYSLSLAHEEKNPADHGLDDEEQAQAAERSNRPQAGQGRAEAAKVEVKIDFDGMGRRTRQITRLSDNVTTLAVSPDSRLTAFVTVGDQEGRMVSTLHTIAEDSILPVTVTSSGRGEAEDGGGGPAGARLINSLEFSKDGRTIYFMEAEGMYAVDLGPAAAAGARAAAAATARSFDRRRIGFTAHVEVNHREERKQVFEESWRIMKDRFYDAQMHGADWARARATYAPLMEYVGDQEEMHNVISQMIGELNASHTGINAPPSPEERDHSAQTRFPGFEMEPDSSGYYKVTTIYKDGPADKDYVRLSAGNYVLAIDGHELKSGDNYWKYLTSVRGDKMEFTVNSKPAADGAWPVKIAPVNGGAYTTLQYERWVAQRRAIVDKLSNGEIGYLHIRSMDAPSLRRFERDLVENHYKKALVIDQRFNPGGGIDQELLEILGQRQYQVTRNRGSVQITRPQRAFFGPMVVMENERSTSDAEVFPDGFRTLGLGKVVGRTTYGAVIGTGAYRLLDGSSIRTPATGLWNVKGYNLENYGVPPDVDVDNTPEDFLAGRDAQLEKAVEVLKQELQNK
ncbi:MAG TPA: S41 family peptidase [Candidatus Saccharimonadales bacterium]|nr:S41 family peptidase [Candidatus Saccharimonadales bacterium]